MWAPSSSGNSATVAAAMPGAGPACGTAAGAGQHAVPRFGKVGGWRGDAVAGDTDPGAQSGELAGDGAGRGQRA